MLIAIGDKVYNPQDTPIIVYFTEQDKKTVAVMPEGIHHYIEIEGEIDVPRKWIDKMKDEIAKHLEDFEQLKHELLIAAERSDE